MPRDDAGDGRWDCRFRAFSARPWPWRSGWSNYRLIVSVVGTKLRALDRSQTAEERATFERKLVLLRRIVLWTDIIVFPFVGYFIGRTIAG